MTHDVYIYEGKAYLDAAHTELFSTRVSFGDEFDLTIHFPAGLVQAGQWLMVAVDRDMLFGEDGTSPMCKAVVLLDNADSCTIALPTNSISFYDAVNGARIPVSCYLGVYAFDDVDESDSDAGYPQRQLALATMQALPVVATLRDTVVPLKPQDLYYTKSEVDASFVANSEKGMADGVATLDENGKVPREQIPEGGSIVIDDTLSTTSQNPVQNKVITLAMQNKADLTEGKVPSSQLPADIINTIDTITVNGTPAPISGKTVALTIPQPTEQVQADWTESDTSKKSYILHKPDLTIYVEKEAGKGLSTNDFTNALKSKLDDIEAGAEVNAQADWTEADTTSDSYIKHKPALATVATSGSYNDLTDKPTIPQPVPQVQADWDESDSTEVSYIQNKPSLDFIPTSEKDVANGVATLDSTGKVPSAELPAMDYIPNAEKGVANGVATLDNQGKVPASELDVISPIIGTTAPTTSTAGKVGQLYLNSTTGKTYTCTAVADGSYTWIDDVNANGGMFTGNITLAYGRSLALYPSSTAGNGCIVFRAGNCNNWWSIAGYSCKAFGGYTLAFGNTVEAHNSGAAFGKYSTTYDAVELALKVGIGTATSNRKDGLQLDWSGNLFVAGGHQQGITTIPAATTAYTPAEGVYNHTPDTAPTYTLPAISNATRTHEVILYVTFSASALSVAFEDAGGSTITPAPEPDISAGKKYCFLCQYIFGAWQVLSIDLGGGE